MSDKPSVQPSGQGPQYVVKWKYRKTPPPGQAESGQGSPMDERKARDFAKAMNQELPDVWHWAEPVQ